MELDKRYSYIKTEDSDVARFSFVAPESGKYVFSDYVEDIKIKDIDGNVIGNYFNINGNSYIYCELNENEECIIENAYRVIVNKTDKLGFFDGAKEISQDNEYTGDIDDIFCFTVPESGYYSIDAYEARNFGLYNSNGDHINYIKSYDFNSYSYLQESIYQFEKGEKIYIIPYLDDYKIKISQLKENKVLTEDNYRGCAIVGENDEYAEFEIDLTSLFEIYDHLELWIDVEYLDIENVEKILFYENGVLKKTINDEDIAVIEGSDYIAIPEAFRAELNNPLASMKIYTKNPGILKISAIYWIPFAPFGQSEGPSYGYYDHYNWHVNAGESFNIEHKNISNFTFSSNNTDIATVDQNGKVTGISPGVATITITSKDGRYTFARTVYVFKTYAVSFVGGRNGDALIKKVLVSETDLLAAPTNREVRKAKNPFFKLFTGRWLDDSGNVVDVENITVQRDMTLHAEYANIFRCLKLWIFKK